MVPHRFYAQVVGGPDIMGHASQGLDVEGLWDLSLALQDQDPGVDPETMEGIGRRFLSFLE